MNSASSEVGTDRGTGTTQATTAPRHPPGPKGLPVIGYLLPFLKNPMEAVTQVAREYGGMARIPIRGKYLYLCSDPEMLKELLITHRTKYMKNIRYRHIQALVGQGLLLSEAAEWRRQRVITQPAFKPDTLDAQVGWMGEHTERFLDRWKAHADRGATFDVEPDFNRLAQLLSGRFLLGEPFADIADEFCDIAADVKKHWPAQPRNLIAAFMKPNPKKIALFDAAIERLDKCLLGFVQKHRATDYEGCGVLTRIVRTSREEGNLFDDKSLRDQLSTMFFAGHETSATGLCWIHWALSNHPAVRAKLNAEVATLGGRIPTAEDVHHLQYTQQVIEESLRLHSPIHAISRVAMEDNTVGGFFIPKGQTVVISMYAIHRQDRLYPDAERFDPDRFAPEEVARRHRFAYLPFAAGHRNCIGAAQAMIELKLIVARIAQRYVLTLDPTQKVDPAPGTTMYPRYGMRMKITHAPGQTNNSPAP
ncbi:MAG: cytochrome [Steroidobacteraceae bacterium]|jgi:cytochrome P450|nr:cytochrome [Steroidobacteraceae bacterium]